MRAQLICSMGQLCPVFLAAQWSSTPCLELRVIALPALCRRDASSIETPSVSARSHSGLEPIPRVLTSVCRTGEWTLWPLTQLHRQQ